MCKCNECNKKDTENCIRIMESNTHQQQQAMHEIEIETLKYNYNNLFKGIGKNDKVNWFRIILEG